MQSLAEQEDFEMIQDLSFGKLENEFRSPVPVPGDKILCFGNSGILIHRDEREHIFFPDYEEVVVWAEDWSNWGGDSFRYVFRMQDVNYFLFMGDSGNCPDSCYHYEQVRTMRDSVVFDPCYAAFTGWHLFKWYRGNRFCGSCGSKTIHDDKERMLRCPDCGNMIFPRINPAVIVAVTDGDRLVLTKYAY